MPAITMDEMRDKMLTVEQLTTILGRTEPLAANPLEGQQVRFTLDESSTTLAIADDPTANVRATMSVQNGPQFDLSRDALLEATSIFGLPKGYVQKCPSNLIEDQLNYWFNHTDKQLKVLHTDTTALAFTRASIHPYSNLALLEQVTEGLEAKYGVAPEDLLVDYKLEHNLRESNFRVILPQSLRRIPSARDTDEVPDNWSVGIQVRNSLIGEKNTSLQGYLFAYICTNGMTSVRNSSGNWSRRGAAGSDEAAVYNWARTSVDEILGGLEHEFDDLDAMTGVVLGGEINDHLREVFEEYAVPANARERIIGNMVATDDLTAYGLHAAITEAANDPELNAAAVVRLMNIGGAYPQAVRTRCDTCHRITAHSH